MLISREHRSPHFEDDLIPVEFVVIHYTAQSLKGSLNILTSGSLPVSCHLLIDEEGQVYELVESWEGKCKKAFHAGQSFFKDSEGKEWKEFNRFSIGIELVNWNGNIFPFKEKQYKALFEVLNHLKSLYPGLQNPERLLGHEHVSGFRGKKDPGALFDWPRLFQSVYPGQSAPDRVSVLTKKQSQLLSEMKDSKNWSDKRARQISRLMERKPKSWSDKKARRISRLMEKDSISSWMIGFELFFWFVWW